MFCLGSSNNGVSFYLQRAVESFVRAQSSAVARIGSLEEQISSYRSHIGDLKRELYAACNREAVNGVDLEVSRVVVSQ